MSHDRNKPLHASYTVDNRGLAKVRLITQNFV